MALADRNNPYSFDEYIEWRNNVDFWEDDPFLRKTIRHYTASAWPIVDEEVKKISKTLSQRWRELLDEAARPENAIYMQHYDAYNNRIDKIVRPREMEVLEKEMFDQAMFSEKTHPWVTLTKLALFLEHGEAGVNCPLACTLGLITLLEQFADTPETLAILEHLKEGKDGHFGRGAQYLSEIQGGSDVQANRLEAVKTEGAWRLYGDKFFCSAAQCDYTVVTAKPRDSHDVGLFVVPSYLPGDEAKGRRNGFVINRLKDKIGSKEMPTAEITFTGAIAYPLGELDRGVANVLQYVLSQSRLNCCLSAATGNSRNYREVKKYTEFRSAFGIKIADFPLVELQVRKLSLAAKRCTASAFKIGSEFLRNQATAKSGNKDESLESKKLRFDLRQLIMLQKMVTASESTQLNIMAMTLLGGNGMMEDFSNLPRLLRDSVTNQMWEGPRNVLLTQIYMDLIKAGSWYPPEECLRNILAEGDMAIVEPLVKEFNELITHGTLMSQEEKTYEVCERWDRVCDDIVHAYQDIAVNEVEGWPSG